jgi:hypothetical protein
LQPVDSIAALEALARLLVIAQRWLTRLGQEVGPMVLKNSGLVIAVQIESEYGAFGRGTVCTDLRGSKAGGTLDRRTGVGALRCRGSIMRRRSTSWLKYGPRNYSHAIQTERMGLIREATLDGRALANWEHFPLPMEDLKQLRFLAEPCTGPCFYEATFNSASPADTYVDTGHLHKGQFWLNEHNIGRFRAVGRFTRSTRRSRGCSAIQIALHSSI